MSGARTAGGYGLKRQSHRRNADLDVVLGSLSTYTHRRTGLHVDDLNIGPELCRERTNDACPEPWRFDAVLWHADAIIDDRERPAHIRRAIGNHDRAGPVVREGMLEGVDTNSVTMRPKLTDRSELVELPSAATVIVNWSGSRIIEAAMLAQSSVRYSPISTSASPVVANWR